MNRRGFLGSVAGLLGGLCLGGCSSESGKVLPEPKLTKIQIDFSKSGLAGGWCFVRFKPVGDKVWRKEQGRIDSEGMFYFGDNSTKVWIDYVRAFKNMIGETKASDMPSYPDDPSPIVVHSLEGLGLA